MANIKGTGSDPIHELQGGCQSLNVSATLPGYDPDGLVYTKQGLYSGGLWHVYAHFPSYTSFHLGASGVDNINDLTGISDGAITTLFAADGLGQVFKVEANGNRFLSQSRIFDGNFGLSGAKEASVAVSEKNQKVYIVKRNSPHAASPIVIVERDFQGGTPQQVIQLPTTIVRVNRILFNGLDDRIYATGNGSGYCYILRVDPISHSFEEFFKWNSNTATSEIRDCAEMMAVDENFNLYLSIPALKSTNAAADRKVLIFQMYHP